MSFFGNRGPAPSNQPNNSAPSNRDIWNHPVEQPREHRQTQNKDDQNNKKPDNNNGGIDDDTVDDIWNEVKKENSQTQDPPREQQQQQQVDPQKQMADYLASVGLEPIVFTEAEKAELQAGNFDNMMTKVNQKIQQAHVKSLSGTKTLIEDAVKTAVAQAVTTTNSQQAGLRNVQALNAALPWTKDKALGPVAQTVMQRFLDRNMSTEEAIKGVKLWADRMNKQSGTSEVNRNRHGNFSNQVDNEDGGDVDGWLSVLSPKG